MTTTTMTPQVAVAAAMQAVDAAKSAFAEQVRAGFNGAREYLAWTVAVRAARAAGRFLTRDWDAAKAGHDAEWDHLFREANRLSDANRDIHAAHGADGIRKWEAGRAEWLQRAAAYAGHPVTAVRTGVPEGIFKDHNTVRGSHRPIAPQLADPAPYHEAVLAACRD